MAAVTDKTFCQSGDETERRAGFSHDFGPMGGERKKLQVFRKVKDDEDKSERRE